MKNHINFVLFDVLKADEQWKNWHLDTDKDLAQSVIEEADKFANEVLWPLNSVGDKQGCQLDNGQVKTPTGYKEAYDQFCSAGWNNTDENGIPQSVSGIVGSFFCGTNMAFSMYPGLTHGVYNVLNLYGNDTVKRTLLPKLISGETSGTMCLTEPQCGSDLSLIKTKALKDDTKPDQTDNLFNLAQYKISGNKIFISAGDHDLTNNIFHLVLAKTDLNAPGTKGISLFLVPKFLIDKDVNPTEQRNGVDCIGLEHKMGIKGSATAQLSFTNSVGYLVGEENKGLQYMFAMMNEARFGVGVQGLGASNQAYKLAYDYAKERVAGKSLYKEHSQADHSPIIHQPEVRKMLMRQRVSIEAGYYLVAYVGHLLDCQHHEPNPKTELLIGLLTPIVKSYLTDGAVANTNDAIQVFGGHGYVSDYHVEQLARDARITTIYEGTNSIQALDLLGRKILGKSGPAMMSLSAEIKEHAENILIESVIPYSTSLVNTLKDIQTLSFKIMSGAMQNPATVGAVAKDYLDLTGLVVFAHSWLKMLESAHEKGELETVQRIEQSAQFFFAQVWPERLAYIERIGNGVQGVEQTP